MERPLVRKFQFRHKPRKPAMFVQLYTDEEWAARPPEQTLPSASAYASASEIEVQNHDKEARFVKEFIDGQYEGADGQMWETFVVVDLNFVPTRWQRIKWTIKCKLEDLGLRG